MKAITEAEYRQGLKDNMVALNAIAYSDLYPCLSALLLSHGKSLYRKLSALHNYFLNYGEDERQRVSCYDGRGWEMMLSYDIMTSLGAGKDKKTWEAAIKKLCALQLLGCFKPRIGEYSFLNSSVQQLSADRAAAEGHNPVTWYRIPRYTDKLLRIADQKAEAVKLMGNGIDKDAIRDMWGADQANRVTDTGYNIHGDTIKRREALRNAVQGQLNQYGYTNAKQIIQEATQAAEGVSNAYRWYDTWRAYKPLLFREMGLKESRPTKEEKAKYNITSDSWIIRRTV